VETSLLPWALEDVQLGDEVLELGPGPGVTTRLLARSVPRLTALELDAGLAGRLRRQLGEAAAVVCGDAAALPFAGDRFSADTCFTMLHHVPSPALQDRLFAEAFRVLRPGGRLAGVDSRPSLRFRLVHLFDTMVVVCPATLPARLAAVGFDQVRVSSIPGRVRLAARKPAPG
jgi:SAM-dependent methyltransferase